MKMWILKITATTDRSWHILFYHSDSLKPKEYSIYDDLEVQNLHILVQIFQKVHENHQKNVEK